MKPSLIGTEYCTIAMHVAENSDWLRLYCSFDSGKGLVLDVASLQSEQMRIHTKPPAKCQGLLCPMVQAYDRIGLP